MWPLRHIPGRCRTACGSPAPWVAAPDLVAELPAGALVLADLGYFSFPWFDDLTDAGHYWISRMRNPTS